MEAYKSNDNGVAAVADAALSVFTISPFWARNHSQPKT